MLGYVKCSIEAGRNLDSTSASELLPGRGGHVAHIIMPSGTVGPCSGFSG